MLAAEPSSAMSCAKVCRIMCEPTSLDARSLLHPRLGTRTRVLLYPRRLHELVSETRAARPRAQSAGGVSRRNWFRRPGRAAPISVVGECQPSKLGVGLMQHVQQLDRKSTR